MVIPATSFCRSWRPTPCGFLLPDQPPIPNKAFLSSPLLLRETSRLELSCISVCYIVLLMLDNAISCVELTRQKVTEGGREAAFLSGFAPCLARGGHSLNVPEPPPCPIAVANSPDCAYGHRVTPRTKVTLSSCPAIRSRVGGKTMTCGRGIPEGNPAQRHASRVLRWSRL